ncbi:class I SAM-dependent methyltransferase [Myroides marinus]|jgi:predicted O-methyltransferase YrrM|uniref:Methyltransferase n=1 Tax=Myroides marinus TaxID=703342 RepID=A0A165RKP4_9FLAO|nr:O-methyltransferase [Myroides marinus]MDR0194863.1 O-methyltransferase [Myroides sp.]KUF45447.1 methyltransferase [Myroides marinus]KZE83092.1 methyltransferase [Myroides marinus]MDM1345491.1 class I SAM-dependent methyltransferase [Myroides marinus]MDM1349080.1 class I SAM-dependent methyltransferase [Myroides marinus]
MHFISPELEDYAARHSEDEPELLAKLDKETYQKVLQPRMLSGHFQGRFLSMISKLVNPQHILEVGTFTGYATLSLAEGLRADGTIDTIDVNEELVDFQRKYFDMSGYGEQITQHLGSALDIIPTLDKKFDLVFLDADKKNYTNYFHLIIEKMNKGGIILSDNVLWSGKVVEEIKWNDRATIEIDQYNKLLKEDPRVETILLPIRDGLTVSRVR